MMVKEPEKETLMSDICFITTCMGRLAHLQQTLPLAVTQVQSQCVVVDYSCPQKCGDWVEQHYPGVKVVRVPGQTRFNISRARNLGAQVADAPWFCFFDADTLLDEHFADLVRPRLEPRCFFTAQPWVKGLMGTFLCSRDDFLRAGGYDEVFQGWGTEDRDLYLRLGLLGVTERGFPSDWLHSIPHDDELRVENRDMKNLRAGDTQNSLYLAAKMDLMKLRAASLSLAERHNLYEEAGKIVQHWLQTGQQAQWCFKWQKISTRLGPEIHSTLVYSLAAKQ
jgi:glycosyltransferase involved in cell wall biosynthesis